MIIMSASRMADLDISVRCGHVVESIDRDGRQVLLSDGSAITYDRLALATGGRNRQLSSSLPAAKNVFYLRTLEDANRLRGQLEKGRRLVIIGGGFIGLEVAAAAIDAGLQVTVLESQDRLLARATTQPISDYIESRHRDNGVAVIKLAHVAALLGDHDVREVELSDGSRVPADLVLVGIGLQPNTALAQSAGLEVRDGIVVDAFSRTSDPRIVAAGDCTTHPSAWTGGWQRLESVQNAIEQGRTAASTLVDDLTKPYEVVPWFWSDQYDFKLQIAGLSAGYDQAVLRGDPHSGSFSVFYVRAGRLIAADSINAARDHMYARQAISARLVPDIEHLKDIAAPLRPPREQ